MMKSQKKEAPTGDNLNPYTKEQIEAVIAAVAKVCKLKVYQMIAGGKKRDIVDARHIAMFIINSELDVKYKDIAARFGVNRRAVNEVILFKDKFQENGLLYEKVNAAKAIVWPQSNAR